MLLPNDDPISTGSVQVQIARGFTTVGADEV
jgi:hypothetical protein